MASPVEKEIAQWMAEQFLTKGILYQQVVASYVIRTYGKDHVSRNRNGNWALNTGILDEFRKLTPDDIVWSRSQQHWRKRRPTDKPGRMQR